MHPKSWWWTPEIDFYAAILHALRGANWQRSGGQGPRPEEISRPYEDGDTGSAEISSVDELEARKQAFYDHMQRRQELTDEGGD